MTSLFCDFKNKYSKFMRFSYFVADPNVKE